VKCISQNETSFGLRSFLIMCRMILFCNILLSLSFDNRDFVFHCNYILVLSSWASADFMKFPVAKKPKYVGQYRVTDSDSLEAAMEAAGRIRLTRGKAFSWSSNVESP
jgi:hypothetical protein